MFLKRIEDEMTKKYLSLCYRCQHRVDFLEKGFGLRCECQDVGKAVCSCYAYVPIKPLVMRRNTGERRPMFGPSMISARTHSYEEADCELKLEQVGKTKGVIYWVPKESK
jgi:hypothetical protein